MSLINPAQPDGNLNFMVALANHALRVLRDPGFQEVVKLEAWQFVVKVSAEARAAWLRDGG